MDNVEYGYFWRIVPRCILIGILGLSGTAQAATFCTRTLEK